MAYLIIFIVVFVALSPLISLWPGRRQRRLAGLRQAALEAGLRVELRRFPEADENAPRRAFYVLRPGRGGGQAPGRSVLRPVDSAAATGGYDPESRRGSGDWEFLEGQWPPGRVRQLAALPLGVELVIESPAELAVAWDESGDREDVRQISVTLNALMTPSP